MIYHSTTSDSIKTFYRGQKRYEPNRVSSRIQLKTNKNEKLSNHLGNVLAVITDRRLQACGAGDVMYYEAQIVSVSDYYPFGMQIQKRSYSATSYRFGFNGMELDNESFSGAIAFEARIYDSRLGRFLSRDPREADYAWLSTYAYYANSPISKVDHLGMGDGDDKDPIVGTCGVKWKEVHLSKKIRYYLSPKYWKKGGRVDWIESKICCNSFRKNPWYTKEK